MQKKRACLCISGSGRSGTTILSVLLSQDAGAVNVGQLRDIWAGWAIDAPCTCGQTVNTCTFWGKLRAQVFPGQTADQAQQIETAMRRFLADAATLRDWDAAQELNALAKTHAAFLGPLRLLIDAIYEISNARLLVDSSKAPEFALALHLAGGMDLFVLNLVRDPRAVACSWAKKKPGKVNQRIDAWGQRQTRLTHWQDAAQLHHRTLRYEDFVAAPERSLDQILTWVGEPLPEDLFTEASVAQVSWARQHLFPPSNETVLDEKAQRVEVRAPTQWRARQYWPLHMKTLLRSFPQGPAYVLGLGQSRRRFEP